MTDEVLIERIRDAMHAEVEGLQPPAEVVQGVLAVRPGRRLGLSWLAPALAVCVAAVVAVVAITSLSHRSPAPPSTASTVPLAARRLVSRLAVLRRPQTRADVLPRWAARQTESFNPHDKLIGGLTRLVGSVDMGQYGSARVYLVVVKRYRMSGYVPAIAFVGAFREEAAINGPTVAFGNLTTAFGRVLSGGPGNVTGLWGSEAGIVPDGVARVKWVFGGPGTHTPQLVVWPRVANNVAVGRVPAIGRLLTGAIWYSRSGHMISSFGLVTGSTKNLGRQAIAPSLRSLFSVLRDRPPAPAQITAVPPSSVGSSGMGLDYAQARFVPYPSAPTLRGEPRGLWVVGGSHGIALLSDGLNVAGSCDLAWPSCSPADNSGRGVFMLGSTGYGGGRQNFQGMVPDGNTTVTVEMINGARHTARVIDNVFSITVPKGAVALIDKNAAGNTVRSRL